MNISKAVLAVITTVFISMNLVQASGFYVGAGVGFNDTDLNGDDVDSALAAEGFTSATSIDDGSLGFQVFAGYEINQYFAIEGGWTDLGKAESDSDISAPSVGTAQTEMEVDGFKLGLQAGTEVTKNFSVFANLGMFFWDAEYDSSAQIGGEIVRMSTDDDGTDLYFGLGAEYAINEALGVRGEWNRYTLNGDTDTDIDQFSINAIYRF